MCAEKKIHVAVVHHYQKNGMSALFDKDNLWNLKVSGVINLDSLQ